MALEPKSVKNPHSVPVPRLYKFCSKVLVEYFQFKGKIPKLILQLARKEPGSMIKLANKLLLALEAKLNIVKAAVENIGVLEKNPGLRYELALVIAADMLLNEVQSKRFERLCKPVLTMLEVREQLQQEYQRCLQDAPAAEDRCKPRWVCVNTLLMSTTEAKQRLTEAGFSLKHYTPRSYEQFLLSVRDLEEHEFMEDFHFAEVLVFPSVGLSNNHLVVTGKLLIQDKVSYLSPSVCGVTPGEVVLDACAAPGNKSTVLATLLNNHGKLICVEQDSERFSVLRRRVKHHGVRCASFINQDFSSLTAEQCEGVTTVLLDPSCSNSGVDLPTDEASVSDERYRRLSDMQFKLLSFALNIPSVRTVVYSTCSVNSMENENVVARALDRFGDSFELEDLSLKLEGWRNFGDESYSFARKVLRTKPEFDLCHGFFVVKFVAREERNCMQQPYMDISNGISKTNDEIDPIKTRKKKKRDDKSLLCVAEIDFDKGTNFVEHGHATSIEKRGSEATVSLDVLRESEETASVCELKKNKKKKKKRNDMEKQLSNDESIPFKIKKSSSDEVQGLDGDEDLTTKKKKKKKRENADEMSALSTSNENFKLEMNEQQMTVSEVEKQNSCENFESKSRKKKKHQKDVIVDEGNQEHKKKKKKTEERQKLDGNDDLDSEKQGLKRVCCGEESLCDLENVRPKKKKKQDKVSLIGSFQEKK